jgi:hypothetical protein
LHFGQPPQSEQSPQSGQHGDEQQESAGLDALARATAGVRNRRAMATCWSIFFMTVIGGRRAKRDGQFRSGRAVAGTSTAALRM